MREMMGLWCGMPIWLIATSSTPFNMLKWRRWKAMPGVNYPER
jgi:hypothetical protein